MIPRIRHTTIARLHRPWTQHLLILVLSLVLALSIGLLSVPPKSEVAWQQPMVVSQASFPPGSISLLESHPLCFSSPSSQA